MEVDKYGQVSVTESEVFEALYSGNIKNLKGIFLDNPDAVKLFNTFVDINADHLPKLETLPEIDEFDSIELFDQANQVSWFIPEDKVHHNLVEMLYGMCETKEQTDRVSLELQLYIQHGMMDMLFYLKYLVDTMRENNIVWGVGRGSSVASYVLYLMGIHKVDSLKYELDIHEFLKQGE